MVSQSKSGSAQGLIVAFVKNWGGTICGLAFAALLIMMLVK